MFVVGAGRVGLALKARAEAAGQAVTLVDRTSGWDALATGAAPILLAVRNDDLDEVVDRTPPERRRDLVFLQNGALRDWLASQGLQSATRGLLYFLVAARGAPLVEGRTSWFSGPHAAVVAAWFEALGVEARAVDWATFSYQELEKLVWLAAHGPLCEHFGATVAEVGTQHREALRELAGELWAVGARAWGVEAPIDHVVERLVDYSSTLPDYRASVKEWRWRNGWFRDTAARLGLETAMHERLLRALGHV